jgi:hypothetical protein
MPTTLSKEVVDVKDAIWSRIGPAAGILFFALVYIGFAIHRYPELRPTDAHLAQWFAAVDVTRFRAGIFVEAVGIALLLPFVAWLSGHLRQGARDSSWLGPVMVAGAAVWVTIGLALNEAWVGLLDQARNGLDIRMAQTFISINQATYDMTGIVLGLILIAAGAAALRSGTMSRWVGWAAVIIGLLQVVTAPTGINAGPTGLLADLWILGVSGYYTIRPDRVRELVTATAQPSVAAGIPATR